MSESLGQSQTPSAEPERPVTYAPAPSPRVFPPGAMIFSVVAGILTLISSFVPLFVGDILFQGQVKLSLVIDGWGFKAVAGPGVKETPAKWGALAINGGPLVLATVALVAAGILAMVALRSAGLRMASVVTSTLAAGLLIGTVFTIIMQAASWGDSLQPTGRTSGVTTEPYFGLGIWLLIVAVVFSVVALMLAIRQGRTPAPVVAPVAAYPVEWPPQSPQPPVEPHTQET